MYKTDPKMKYSATIIFMIDGQEIKTTIINTKKII